MKKSFLLLTLVVAVSISGFAKGQSGSTHQRASAGTHKSQGQGMASHGYQGQKQSMSGSQQMGGAQQTGGNGHMGQGNKGQMSQNHHGNGNTMGSGNPNNGMNGNNSSSGMAQGQSGNSQQP